MNLITDAWIPVRSRSGAFKLISPIDLTDTNDPAIQLDAVRPDFNGALAQFLIGLLYTLMPPKDDEVWEDVLCNPPTRAVLEAASLKAKGSFELLSDSGPAFMQDFSPSLDGGRKPKKGKTKDTSETEHDDEGEAEFSENSIQSLLVDAPLVNTIKLNRALFSKPAVDFAVRDVTAAQMLLSLQINGPGRGTGYFKGIRGDGPITTLLWPAAKADGAPTSLFEKIWINVLTQTERHDLKTAFPWCAETITSEGDRFAYGPQLWDFWATPIRIRLNSVASLCECSLDRRLDRGFSVETYITRNFGAHYPNERKHPLSPHQEIKPNVFVAIKAKKGSMGFQDWPSLISDGEYQGKWFFSAAVLDRSDDVRQVFRSRFGAQFVVWAFGVQFNKASAEAWHEKLLPSFAGYSRTESTRVYQFAAQLANAANIAKDKLEKAFNTATTNPVKNGKPKKKRKPNELIAAFYDRLESSFYKTLDDVASLEVTTELKQSWVSQLRRTALDLFEEFTQSVPPESDGRLARAERTSEADGDLRRYLGRALNDALDLPSPTAKSKKTKPATTQKEPT
jgi:CRISPR system Cascade subunit CasA